MQFYIETERLIMRDMQLSDADGMLEMSSDPEVHRYLGGDTVNTMAGILEVIEMIRKQYEDNGIGRWTVLKKDTGEFIGWSGLKLIKEPINGRYDYYDIGYRFIKRYWGMGYATETALATIRYAREVMNLTDIYGMADIDNTASRNVLQKIGLKQHGSFMYDGADHAFYKMTL